MTKVIRTTTGGPKIIAGTRGLPGPPGLSAYQVAVLNGFVGTEAEWLASLEGDIEDPGDLTLIFNNGLV